MEFVQGNLGLVIGLAITVIVLLSVLPMIIKAFKLINKVKSGAAETMRLTKEGRSAKAKVLKIQPTGTMVNFQPLSVITLEVNSGIKYEVTVQMVINQIFLPSVQPGKIVPVKIDPQDKNKVILDVEKLGTVDSSEA